MGCCRNNNNTRCTDRELLRDLFEEQNCITRCHRNCRNVDDILAGLGCNKWNCGDANCTGCEIAGSCSDGCGCRGKHRNNGGGCR
ncbi:MAG: hypothetical protein BGN88_03370 [Clostridiales bacterium 43-6]|nr:MAG: hypothetical protein BGN88_03370 [Clostridiales bacterium 43-6]